MSNYGPGIPDPKLTEQDSRLSVEWRREEPTEELYQQIVAAMLRRSSFQQFELATTLREAKDELSEILSKAAVEHLIQLEEQDRRDALLAETWRRYFPTARLLEHIKEAMERGVIFEEYERCAMLRNAAIVTEYRLQHKPKVLMR